MDEAHLPTRLNVVVSCTCIALLGLASWLMLGYELSAFTTLIASQSSLVKLNAYSLGLFGFGLFLFAVVLQFAGTRVKALQNQRLTQTLGLMMVVSVLLMITLPALGHFGSKYGMPKLGYTYCEHAGSPHFQRFRPLYFTTTAQACYEEWLRHR